MATATATDSTKILIQAPAITRVTMRLDGITPLLTARVTEAAKEKLKKYGEGGETGVQEHSVPLTPEQQYLASRYMIDEKTHGFPATAVKKAMISAVRMLDKAKLTTLSMIAAKPMFTTYPAEGHHTLMELAFGKCERHDDWARNQKSGAWVPVHRSVYFEWSCLAVIQFDARLIAPATIVNLLAVSGQVGIGAKRPECDGNNGMYEVSEAKAKPKKRSR